MSDDKVTFLEPPAMRSTDSLPVRATSPDLIDLEKVATHIERASSRGRYRGPSEPLEYLLAKKCLVKVGAEVYATLAGILCFGHNPQAVFPRAVVDIGHYRGTETLSYEVVNLDKDVGGTIFNQLARIETYLWSNTYHGMTLSETSYQRVEIHEFPQAVIRELGVNMIAHRDYANYLSACQVQKFKNRIAWVSPGGLPPGMTVDNILSAQASRNPIILSILYEAGYVEAFGQGLDTVVRVLAEEEMAPPQFQDTGVSFVVTVYGRPIELMQPQGDQYGALTDTQRMILTLIRSKTEVPPRDIRTLFSDRAERSIQRDLKVLMDANLIVAVGGSRSLRYRIREATE
jgi:predicted HTH transcriptional regulator